MKEIEELFLHLKDSYVITNQWREFTSWGRIIWRYKNQERPKESRIIMMPGGTLKTNREGELSNYFDIGKVRDYIIYNRK